MLTIVSPFVRSIRPTITDKTLIAIGAHEWEGWLSVVTFETDSLPEITSSGEMMGDKFCVTVVLNDTIYAIGGYRVDFRRRVLAYDIRTKEANRVAVLRFKRSRGHSATTSDFEIFVCGGNFSGSSKSCEAFNQRTHVVRRLPDMRQGRANFPLVFLPHSRLLAIGGGIGTHILSACEMLEIASPSAGWRVVAPMRRARRYHAAVHFDNRVLVAGISGAIYCEIYTPPLFGSTTEMGQWTSVLPRMTRTFVSSTSLIVVSKREILFYGIISGDNGEEGAVERFAPNAGSVSEEVDFNAWTWTPLPRIRHLDKGYTNGVHRSN